MTYDQYLQLKELINRYDLITNHKVKKRFRKPKKNINKCNELLSLLSLHFDPNLLDFYTYDFNYKNNKINIHIKIIAHRNRFDMIKELYQRNSLHQRNSLSLSLLVTALINPSMISDNIEEYIEMVKNMKIPNGETALLPYSQIIDIIGLINISFENHILLFRLFLQKGIIKEAKDPLFLTKYVNSRNVSKIDLNFMHLIFEFSHNKTIIECFKIICEKSNSIEQVNDLKSHLLKFNNTKGWNRQVNRTYNKFSKFSPKYKKRKRQIEDKVDPRPTKVQKLQ